ncbi:MAG: TetR/AcrR family transcriptional regulator [Chloroflexota bacterium]
MARRPALPGIDRRLHILEAALDVFAEQGFEGATTKEVAARADVTHGLIYFYFRDKDELFAAACQHQGERVFGAMNLAAVLVPDDPPESVLRRVIAQIVRSLAEPASISLLRVMMRTSVHDQGGDDAGEAGRACIRSFGRELVAEVRSYLETQVPAGTLRVADADLAAQVLVTTIVHFMIRRALGDQSLAHDSLEEQAGSITTILLHGLLSPSDAPEPAQSTR